MHFDVTLTHSKISMLLSPEFDLIGLYIVAYFGINYATNQKKNKKSTPTKTSTVPVYLRLVQSHLDGLAY